MTEWRARSALVAVAVVADRLVGDPPDRLHPVAWFGRSMARREERAWRDDRRSGMGHLGVGLLVAIAPVVLLRTGSRRIGVVTDRVLTVAVVTMTLGGRSLDRRAAEVERALTQGRVDLARQILPALVGRDPAALDEGEIVRAVVESVAENTIDAVVAPLVWASLLGAAGAAAYRAVNTLDAMVGYRSERYRRFGWASARADDLANLVPARLGALLVALSSPRSARDLVRVVVRQASDHPSPNAGVAEAAFAAALGVRLGGTNSYGGTVEQRGVLGTGRAVEVGDIARARSLSRRVTALAAAALAAPCLAGLVARLVAERRRGARSASPRGACR